MKQREKIEMEPRMPMLDVHMAALEYRIAHAALAEVAGADIAPAAERMIVAEEALRRAVLAVRAARKKCDAQRRRKS